MRSTVQSPFDDLADTTSRTAREARRAGAKALDRVMDTASDWRDQAAPVVDRVRRGVVDASDRTVGYVRDEPVRTLLMAAAAGALVYAVMRLMDGRDSR